MPDINTFRGGKKTVVWPPDKLFLKLLVSVSYIDNYVCGVECFWFSEEKFD